MVILSVLLVFLNISCEFSTLEIVDEATLQYEGQENSVYSVLKVVVDDPAFFLTDALAVSRIRAIVTGCTSKNQEIFEVDDPDENGLSSFLLQSGDDGCFFILERFTINRTEYCVSSPKQSDVSYWTEGESLFVSVCSGGSVNRAEVKIIDQTNDQGPYGGNDLGIVPSAIFSITTKTVGQDVSAFVTESAIIDFSGLSIPRFVMELDSPDDQFFSVSAIDKTEAGPSLNWRYTLQLQYFCPEKLELIGPTDPGTGLRKYSCDSFVIDETKNNISQASVGDLIWSFKLMEASANYDIGLDELNQIPDNGWSYLSENSTSQNGYISPDNVKKCESISNSSVNYDSCISVENLSSPGGVENNGGFFLKLKSDVITQNVASPLFYLVTRLSQKKSSAPNNEVIHSYFITKIQLNLWDFN